MWFLPLCRCVVGVCLTGALRAMAAASVQDAFLRAMDQLAAPWPANRAGGQGGSNRDIDHGGEIRGDRGNDYEGANEGANEGAGPSSSAPPVDWRSRGCVVELLAHVSLGVASENADQRVEASRLQIDRYVCRQKFNGRLIFGAHLLSL